MTQEELAQLIIMSGGHCCDISCSGKAFIGNQPTRNPGVPCPLYKVDCFEDKTRKAKEWMVDNMSTRGACNRKLWMNYLCEIREVEG